MIDPQKKLLVVRTQLWQLILNVLQLSLLTPFACILATVLLSSQAMGQVNTPSWRGLGDLTLLVSVLIESNLRQEIHRAGLHLVILESIQGLRDPLSALHLLALHA